METTIDTKQNDLERTLVERFIALKEECTRLSTLAASKKERLDEVEAELIDLLNDENKKASARFEGIGHVTCMKPIVGRAYIVQGEEEVLFEYLRKIERDDLIKTGVNNSSLRAFIGQCLKSGEDTPPGVEYRFKQTLRAYPQK